MIFIVYVQGIEVARFYFRSMAEWFVNKLKAGDDSLLNFDVTQVIDSPCFQDCEIIISEYDSKDL